MRTPQGTPRVPLGGVVRRHDAHPGQDGTSDISGVVADQSALHVLLRQLSDLGMPLLSVTRTNDAEAPTSTTNHHTRRTTT